MASKGCSALERPLGTPSCLEADLPDPVQTGAVTGFEAGQNAFVGPI